MKKVLKFIFPSILLIFILGIVYFLSKWKKVNIDENIGKSAEIKQLDKKNFDSLFLIFDSTKVNTDFEIFENKSNTVTFNFDVNKSSKFPNTTFLNFNSGDGFSGVNVNVTKYKKFFHSSIKSYSDVVGTFDFLNSDKYAIKTQKLTLNKSEYNKGDSIYGKIELQIEFKPDHSIYSSKGYFRSVVK